jgi:hypothetical protein
MAKYQAILFFPLLLLEGFSLHVSSVRALRGKDLRFRKVEMCLLVGHFAAYLTAVFLVLSPLTGIVFILVHQCLWGVYMGCSFAPGHKPRVHAVRMAADLRVRAAAPPCRRRAAAAGRQLTRAPGCHHHHGTTPGSPTWGGVFVAWWLLAHS